MKKKVLAMVLCIAMLAIAIAGGTMAYFTDTKAQTNTFTSGNVYIRLDEAIVAKDDDSSSATYGDLLNTGARTEAGQDYGRLYPGQEICKDPTITNTGSERAYVAAIVRVTDGKGDIYPLIGSGYQGLLRIDKMVSGGIIKENDTQKSDYFTLTGSGLPVYGDSTYTVYQIGDMANGVYTFYVFFEQPLAPGADVTLFEKMTIDPQWNNAEMDNLEELSITVEAYATQEYGFPNCFTAMTSAFSNEFNF